EQELNKNKALLNSILETIPDMIAVQDKDLNVLYCNWNGFANVPAKQRIIGDKCHRVLRNSKDICKDCQAKNVLITKKPFESEAELTDGRWVDLRVIPIFDEKGEVSSFLEWVRDITDFKRSEIQLKEKNEEYLALNEELNQANEELLEAKQKAQENEAVLLAALENSHAGIAIADYPSGKLKFVNKAGLLIRGKDEDDVVKDIDINKYVESWQILHFDGTPYQPEKVPLARAFLNAEKVSEEFIVKRDDFEERSVWANAAPIYDTQGVQIGAIVVFLDITGKKMAEQKMQEYNIRMNLATNSAKIGIWELNLENNNLIWDKLMYEMYGLKPKGEKNNYQTWKNAIYPDDLAKVSQEVDDAVKREKEFNTEFRILKPNDEIRYIKANAIVVKNKQGKPVRMIGTNYDITESRQAEEALRESEKRFATAFKHSPAPLVLSEIDTGLFFDVNDRWVKMLEFTRNEQIGKTSKEVGIWDDPNERDRIVSKLLSNGNFRDEFIKFNTKSGKTILALWSAETITLSGKKVMLSMITDITEQRQAEEELLAAKEKAEKADKLKTAFLANMSHEIRTPLNGLMGFSDVMASQKDLSQSDRVRYADIIRKSGDQLIHIVNDILDISAIENGTLEVNKKPFEVNNALFSLYRIFEQKKQLEQINIGLSFKKALGNIEIVNDENRFMQIFTNLLDNAFKFTHEGRVEFGVDSINDNSVVFFVKDTGIGIDKEQQSIIFDRFRQAEISANKLYGGNGLGLSIVKELLLLMGGTIRVESDMKKGTNFHFTLPYISHDMTSQKSDVVQSVLDTDAPINPKLKILVVEDDLINQAYLREILSEPDLDVNYVETGNGA
ncbi:MAG: PAS domain S-box protein, partial [Bacteroidetes bacterium]|nr:PAS domain S-box protein [Bacteroidota bacterium]